MVTKDHLKSVLKGEKKFLKMKDVRFINPPSYDETSVAHIYDKVVAMKGMSELFPDSYPKGRQCDRQYMYNVWNTVYPEAVKKVIEHANSLRYST